MSATTAPAGESPRVFMHVGSVLLQVGYTYDGRSFPDRYRQSQWSHLATGSHADRMCEHLRGLDVLSPDPGGT